MTGRSFAFPSQGDLFTYPRSAGWRDPTTSRDNALRIEATGRARTLRDTVRAFFDEGGIDTADGLALRLGLPFRAIQPRVSELRAQGYIKPTGERRLGSGGGTCHVWVKA